MTCHRILSMAGGLCKNGGQGIRCKGVLEGAGAGWLGGRKRDGSFDGRPSIGESLGGSWRDWLTARGVGEALRHWVVWDMSGEDVRLWDICVSTDGSTWRV